MFFLSVSAVCMPLYVCGCPRKPEFGGDRSPGAGVGGGLSHPVWVLCVYSGTCVCVFMSACVCAFKPFNELESGYYGRKNFLWGNLRIFFLM